MNTAWKRDMMKWGGFRISYIRRVLTHIYTWAWACACVRACVFDLVMRWFLYCDNYYNQHVIERIRMRWPGHVTWTRDKRGAYVVSTRNSEGQIPLGRPGNRLEDNIAISIFKYNQQYATLYIILYYCQCCTCFRRSLRPSSGAQELYTQHLLCARLACCYR